MKLTNKNFDQRCIELVDIAVEGIPSYDWDAVSEAVFQVFTMREQSTKVNMWYTAIIVPQDKKRMYFAFTQELKAPRPGTIIDSSQQRKIGVIKTGRTGFHGWCKLIVVEGKFV